MTFRELITTDKRISYIDRERNLVVFDVPTRCAVCTKCLAHRGGGCMYGGPFDAQFRAAQRLGSGGE